MPRQLQNQVCRSTKTGQPEPVPVRDPGHAQRAIANRPRTQERRGFGIGEHSGDRVSIRLRHSHVLRVSPINIAASRFKFRAQVFVLLARRPVDPADANTLPVLETSHAFAETSHSPDDLVTGYYWEPWRPRTPFDLVQFSVADTTRRDAHQQLALTGHGNRHLHQPQRLAVLRERLDPP